MSATPELIGTYRIVADLGTGGMGRVYLAEATQDHGDIVEGQRIALKVVHAHLLEREGGFKRFLREADLGGRVRHPNVVRTYDVDALIQDGTPYHFLVMEFVEGQTLRSLLKELGRVPEELCRRIAIEIARGLVGVHEIGIVHRDLKPENVLITKDEQVKIMDLGVSRLVDESIRLSNTGQFVGSLQYAAPEQFTKSADAIDGRTDLYALGCLLYELISGQRPFRGGDPMSLMAQVLSEEPDPPSSRNPEVTEFLEEVVLTLLRKAKEERFQSASELLDVLEQGERSAWWKSRGKRPRRAVAPRYAAVPVDRSNPLVGRGPDLDHLNEALDLARQGRGQVVLVEGEAGIGKSRLLGELAQRLEGDSAVKRVLYGRHPPGDSAPAIAAFAQALGHHVAPGAFDPILLGTSASSAMRAVSVALAGPRPAPDALGRALADAVCELAESGPLVLIVEDLHAAPAEGRELFADVAVAIQRSPVLLVGSTRPGAPKEWLKSLDRMDHARRRVLGRLDAGGVEELVRKHLPGLSRLRDLARVIAVKSDGNPLFVLEILRDLEARGLDLADAALSGSDSYGSFIRLPESLQELIRARLEPLEPEDRRLLDVAACYGQRFDSTLVAEAAGIEPIAALRRLARIESRRSLVRSKGKEFEFEHHQVREVLYDELPAETAKQYHSVIARCLEARLTASEEEATGPNALQICAQLFRAGEAADAIGYLPHARAHAVANGQNEGEVELLNAALATEDLLTGCQRVELLLAKASNLGFVGRPAEQGLVLRDAEALAADVGCDRAQARVLCALGGFELRAGKFERAQHVLVRAEELAVASGDSITEAGVCGRLGRVLKNLGRYREAIAYHKRQLRIVRELEDRRGEIVASANLGSLYSTIGRFEYGREKLERAVGLSQALGWRWGEAMDSGKLGKVFESLGRFSDALPCFERQVQISREEGSPDGEARGLANLGRMDALLGKFELARARLEDGLGIAMDLGRPQLEAGALFALGMLDSWMQNTEAAVGHLEWALESRRAAGSAYGGVADLVALARVHWDVGRRDEATRLFGDANAVALKIHALDAQAISMAYLEYVTGGAPSAELLRFAREREGITALARLDLVTVLWRWTRDDEWAHLSGLHLGEILECSPTDCREQMVTRVPLFVRATSIRDTVPQPDTSG